MCEQYFVGFLLTSSTWCKCKFKFYSRGQLEDINRWLERLKGTFFIFILLYWNSLFLLTFDYFNIFFCSFACFSFSLIKSYAFISFLKVKSQLLAANIIWKKKFPFLIWNGNHQLNVDLPKWTFAEINKVNILAEVLKWACWQLLMKFVVKFLSWRMFLLD